MSIFGDDSRKPIRTSVKKEVHARTSGKCESCGLKISWGSRKGVFHHTRTPRISPTAKTVQFLCRSCHADAHEYKTTRSQGIFFDTSTRKIVRKKLPKKSASTSTRKSSSYRTKKTPKKKVSFTATKKVPTKVRVSFKTKNGETVSFKATKKISKKVKVQFSARQRRKN